MIEGGCIDLLTDQENRRCGTGCSVAPRASRRRPRGARGPTVPKATTLFSSVGLEAVAVAAFLGVFSPSMSCPSRSGHEAIQEPEAGAFGQVAAAPAEVRLRDGIVHQDDRGGAIQVLQALCGAPEPGTGVGFAAIWRDHRDGMAGLYMARFSPTGEILEPERPIHMPHAGRRFDPAVAIAPDGSGAVMWAAGTAATPTVSWFRAFDAHGKFLTEDRPLSDMTPRNVRAPGARMPSVAHLPRGGWAVAWTEA